MNKDSQIELKIKQLVESLYYRGYTDGADRANNGPNDRFFGNNNTRDQWEKEIQEEVVKELSTLLNTEIEQATEKEQERILNKLMEAGKINQNMEFRFANILQLYPIFTKLQKILDSLFPKEQDHSSLQEVDKGEK